MSLDIEMKFGDNREVEQSIVNIILGEFLFVNEEIIENNL